MKWKTAHELWCMGFLIPNFGWTQINGHTYQFQLRSSNWWCVCPANPLQNFVVLVVIVTKKRRMLELHKNKSFYFNLKIWLQLLTNHKNLPEITVALLNHCSNPVFYHLKGRKCMNFDAN